MAEKPQKFTKQVTLKLTQEQFEAFDDDARDHFRAYLDGRISVSGYATDFGSVGLVGLLPDYDACDFSYLIKSSGQLYLYGSDLWKFLSFREHADLIKSRLRRKDLTTHIVFGTFLKSEGLSLNSHDQQHFETLALETLLNKESASVKVVDRMTCRFPTFALIADAKAYVSPLIVNDSPFALVWDDAESGGYVDGLKYEFTSLLRAP